MMSKRKNKISVILLTFLILLTVSFSAACGETKTFTVTFYGNGGSLYSGETVQTVSSVSELEPPVFKREGYVFNGWDIDIENIKSNIALNAQWSPEKYEISFDANGGQVDTEKKEVVFNEKVGSLPVPTHENELFEFSRWVYVDKNVVIASDSIWSYPENATLKAEWIEGYAIYYDLDGGIAGPDTPYSYITGTEISLVAPTKTGYDFCGWTGEGISQPALELTIGENESGNKNYKANWQAKTYTVTLDSDGGNLSEDEITVTFGSPVGNLPLADKSGYNFVGWYYGQNDIKIDNNYIWNIDGENIVLKAKYIPNSKFYTVNFVLTCEVDGRTVKCLYNGKDYIQPVTVAEGQTLGESLVTPVAVNEEYRDYSFVGWYYGDKQITSETVFSNEIFDTAAVTLTVKCKLDGIWTKPY